MLIISLFVHIQQCVVRFRSRKRLARLTTHELSDVGISSECRNKEVAQATLYGFTQDVLSKVKK
ncbi:DUF1127 domain-containing protein [Marinomonas sp. C2222]|uniref:DUF1127 domain-containing protein n=1 Tax=Marinomonas sargassi TaxID=2984494 RepID=A0ABT2YRP1_9GAMM|nr:DUF1127 domain-containing protein [Marinomonas sargassi]MCV2402557.1 DUF1127 domain-containing protein [Marinomonas sargassi]